MMEENLFSKFAVPVLGIAAAIGLTGGYALGIGLIPALLTGLGLVAAAALGLGVASAGGVTPFMTWLGKKDLFGAGPILGEESTASLGGDTIRHAGDIAKVVVPPTAAVVVPMGVTAGANTYHRFANHKETTELLGQAKATIAEIEARKPEKQYAKPKEYALLKQVPERTRGWLFGTHKAYGRRVTNLFGLFGSDLPTINKSKEILAHTDQLIAEGKLDPAKYAHLLDDTSKPINKTATLQDSPTVKDVDPNAKPIDAEIKRTPSAGNFEVVTDADGKPIPATPDAEKAPVTASTEKPAASVEVEKPVPPTQAEPEKVVPPEGSKAAGSGAGAPASETVAGDVKGAKPASVSTTVNSDVEATTTSTIDKPTSVEARPNTSSPADNPVQTANKNPVVHERGGGNYDPVTDQRTPGPHTDMVSEANPKPSKLNNMSLAEIAEDLVPSHETPKHMAAPTEAPSRKQVNTASMPTDNLPRGSLFAAGTQLASGPMRMAYGQTGTEKALGVFEMADGAGEAYTFLRPMSKFAWLAPPVTVAAAGLGAAVDSTRGVNQIKQGEIGEGGANLSLGGLEGGVAVEAVGRTAQVMQNAKFLQPLVSNPLAQKVLGGTMSVGKFAGTKNPWAGAAMGTWQMGRVGVEQLKVDADTQTALKDNAAIHAAGTTHSYADKQVLVELNQTIPVSYYPEPEFHDYKMLAIAAEIVHHRLQVPKEAIETAPPEQLMTYLDLTAQALKGKKEAALAEVKGGFWRGTNILTSESNLARTPEGRASILKRNDARAKYPIIFGGSLSYDPEKNEKVEAVGRIDSEISSIQAAIKAVGGNKSGKLGKADSYSAGYEQFTQTQALREERAAAFDPDKLAEKEDKISEFRDYKQSILYDTGIKEAFDQVQAGKQKNGDAKRVAQVTNLKQFAQKLETYHRALDKVFEKDKKTGDYLIDDPILKQEVVETTYRFMAAEHLLLQELAHEVRPSVFADPNTKKVDTNAHLATQAVTMITGGADVTASDVESASPTSAPLPVADKSQGKQSDTATPSA